MTNKFPNLKIIGEAAQNVVDVARAADAKGSITFTRGSGNRIVFDQGAKFSGSIQFVGNGNTIYLGRETHFRGDIVVKDNGQSVSFGDHSTTVKVYLLCQEGCDITIGRWCMFSRDIEVRTTDAHSVIERSTGKRLNTPASIIIGDHVWVGVSAIINKGSVIPSDSIVGAGAFVNRAFDEEGVVIAGAPAAIVKRDITWNRSRKPAFSREEMDHWKHGE